MGTGSRVAEVTSGATVRVTRVFTLWVRGQQGKLRSELLPVAIADNARMRINLVTPFAEKDAVKALGARWDSTRKIWYITDVKDLTPFRRWIPDMAAGKAHSASAHVSPTTRSNVKASVDSLPAVTTVSNLQVPHCGCDVLPWDDCVHTVKA